jgi:hypothetical protein
VQELFAVIVPPERLTARLPAVAVIVPLPQLPVRPFAVEIAKPEGRVSVKPTPLRAVLEFGLLMVKLKLVLPFSGMLAAPKALVMLGGSTTVRLAFDVFPVPPFVELT